MVQVKNGHVRVRGSNKEVPGDFAALLFMLRTHFTKKEVQTMVDLVEENKQANGEVC